MEETNNIKWLDLNSSERLKIIFGVTFSWRMEGRLSDASDRWFLERLDSFYNNSEYDGLIEPKEAMNMYAKIINVFRGKPIEEKFDKILDNVKPKELVIWNYCQDMLEEYDKIEGKYVGDKYINLIFKNASEKFEITQEEVKKTWIKGDSVAAGINN